MRSSNPQKETARLLKQPSRECKPRNDIFKESQMNHSTAPVVFQFQTYSVRTIQQDGEPWFVAADVCRVLDLADTNKALLGLDDDEKREHEQYSGSGRKPILISESGLYSMILRSRKPEAKHFRKWVTSEVLPAIRKTGKYSTSTAASQPTIEHSAHAFQFGETPIRIILREGLPWFVAADIARALGAPLRSGADVARWCDDDEKSMVTVQGATGGPQQVNIVNQWGVFRTITKSLSPNAKTFQRWLLHEVLPTFVGAVPPAPTFPEITPTPTARYLVSFNDDLRPRVQEVPNTAFIIRHDEFASVLRQPILVPLTNLPEIIGACAERMGNALCLPHLQESPVMARRTTQIVKQHLQMRYCTGDYKALATDLGIHESTAKKIIGRIALEMRT